MNKNNLVVLKIGGKKKRNKRKYKKIELLFKKRDGKYRLLFFYVENFISIS